MELGGGVPRYKTCPSVSLSKSGVVTGLSRDFGGEPLRQFFVFAHEFWDFGGDDDDGKEEKEGRLLQESDDDEEEEEEEEGRRRQESDGNDDDNEEEDEKDDWLRQEFADGSA